LCVGAATGLIDALLVQFNVAQSRGVPYLPESIWFFIPATWLIIALSVAILCSPGFLRRFTVPALILTGPGLLILSRLGPLMRHLFGLRVTWTALVCLMAASILAMIASRRVAIDRSVHDRPLWIATALLGAALVAGILMNTRKGEVNASTLPSGKPSVVLVFLDTMRYDDSLAMPNLGRLRSTAVTFTNAWSVSSWTLPSHYAVFTGISPWKIHFDADAETFEYRVPTMAQRFAASGYSTAAVFANPLLTPGTGFARGFQEFEYSKASPMCRSGLAYLLGRAYTYTGVQGPCGWMSASEVVDRAASFIRRARRPYFLTLNFIDPHDPYYVPRECREGGRGRYSNADHDLMMEASSHGSPLDPAAARRIHDRYRLAVGCMDRSLGRLFDVIDQQPGGEKTIIAVVGDHGEQFGEHGLLGHGNSLYRQVLHVPMLVRSARDQARTVPDPVSITDLYGTLLHLADIRTPARGDLLSGPHRKVKSFLRGAAAADGFTLVDTSYQYIRWNDGREALYDYAADPMETASLQPSVHDGVKKLRKTAVCRLRPRSAQGIQRRSLGYLQ
jgi:arylsulfatase A-like enzyme